MLNGFSLFGNVNIYQPRNFAATFHDINLAIQAQDLKEWPLEEIVLEQ